MRSRLLLELITTNLFKLAEVLDGVEFNERERTDHQFNDLAFLLHNFNVDLRKVRVLGWIGIERLYVAIWT